MPGAGPARDARCAAEGNRDMSPLVSARISWATLGPTPGNGLHKFQLVRPGLAGGSDHGVELDERVLDQLRPVQHGPRQLGVLIVEVPGQRLDELRNLDPHLALRQLREDLRIALPAGIDGYTLHDLRHFYASGPRQRTARAPQRAT